MKLNPNPFRTFCLILFCSITLTSCGKLIGKEVCLLEVNKISTPENMHIGTCTLVMEAGEKVTLWSKMNIEYTGDPSMRFNVEVLRDGHAFKKFEIDPTESNLTIGSVRSEIGNKVKWKFSKKHGSVIAEGASFFICTKLGVLLVS